MRNMTTTENAQTAARSRVAPAVDRTCASRRAPALCGAFDGLHYACASVDGLSPALRHTGGLNDARADGRCPGDA